MPLTTEQLGKLGREMNQSSTALDPSDDQRQNLADLMLDAYKKIQKDKQQSPAASNEGSTSAGSRRRTCQFLHGLS
jgi:hypothetical protein